MEKLPAMVDMSMSPGEAQEQCGPIATPDLPKYPYGLCISLGPDEIEKLGLGDDCEVGNFLHIHALAKVTSYSKRDTESGSDTRIELVLAFMEAEDEGEENDEAEAAPMMPANMRRSKLYRNG